MDFVGCKMSSRKLLKAVWPRNGHPASLGINNIKLYLYFSNLTLFRSTATDAFAESWIGPGAKHFDFSTKNIKTNNKFISACKNISLNFIYSYLLEGLIIEEWKKEGAARLQPWMSQESVSLLFIIITWFLIIVQKYVPIKNQV